MMHIQPLKNYSLSHNVVIIFFVALVYFLLGKIGLLLEIPGTTVSPIWPAAGFALGIILLTGYRAAIGIFFGSFLLNLLQLSFLTGDIWNISAWIVALLTGAGAALQGLFGAFLINKIAYPNYLLKRNLHIILMLCAGALSCLVNTVMGVTSLWMFDFVPWDKFFNLLYIWWLGDLGGVFLVTPLMLAWLQEEKTVSLRKQPFKILEAGALFLWFILAMIINFQLNAYMTYLFSVAVIWAGVRFGFKGATLALLINSIIVSYLTLNGLGQFSMGSTYEMSSILLETFIVVTTAAILLMTAEIENKKTPLTHWEATSPKMPNYFVVIKEIFFRYRYKK